MIPKTTLESSSLCQAVYSRLVIAAVVLTVLISVSPAWAEAPIYKAEPSAEFMKTWLLCGPFPLPEADDTSPATRHLPGFEDDFLHAHGGETAPRIRRGQVETFDGGEVTWDLHTSESAEIDLDDAISNSPNVFAYAYCEIETSTPRVSVLSLGSNDGVRVWLNGAVVADITKGRGLQLDSNRVPVVLKKGRNTLLFKVEERGGSWGFACRLLPFDSPEFSPEQLSLFSVFVQQDGVAILRPFEKGPGFRAIIDKVELEACAADKPDEVVWRDEWSTPDDIVLGVDSTKYGEYLLRAHTRFVDGSSHTYTFSFPSGKRIEHTLFDATKTNYSIVIGRDASGSERWAAFELRHWLRAVSGADFPILEETRGSREREIVVGFNARAQSLLGKGFEKPAEDDQSFQYRNVGPSIVIWGGSQRGTQYGVMTFLERELGCRWYTPGVTVTPQQETYRFHYLRHAESAGIRVRNVFFKEAFDPIWAARNKSNGLLTFGGVREQLGGIDSYWAVHTFYRFLPPKEFFEDHPEYYSLIDGKRVDEHAQLCLSNPEVRRIVHERAIEFIRQNPEHRIYSVSQNDGYGPCECESCQQIVEREGSEIAPILMLVNEIAKEAEREFPDKFIGTLAYVYSRKPPKTIRPRQNVVIRLCSFECCRGHDFYSCPKNATFLEDIQTWSKIAPHLYIWDYVVDFSHYTMPYPNFYAFQRNIQCFRDNNAIGVMPQGSYQSRGGEFAELKMYLFSKLLWNPDCDVQAVIDDFMYGYYGRSGRLVRAYFDLIHERFTADIHLQQFDPEAPYFTEEFIRDCEAIFDEAEIVADSEAVRRRVEMARLPIMYVKCVRTPVDARRDGTYARFCEIVEREGITLYAERGASHRKAFHEAVEAAE